jgi:hypothetical protein
VRNDDGVEVGNSQAVNATSALTSLGIAVW